MSPKGKTWKWQREDGRDERVQLYADRQIKAQDIFTGIPLEGIALEQWNKLQKKKILSLPLESYQKKKWNQE